MLTPLAPKCFAALPNAPSFLTQQAAGGQESSGANGFDSSTSWGPLGYGDRPSQHGANFISLFLFFGETCFISVPLAPLLTDFGCLQHPEFREPR